LPVGWAASGPTDGRNGGIECGIEAVTIEGLEETVATNEILDAGPHFSERVTVSSVATISRTYNAGEERRREGALSCLRSSGIAC